jgi:hypothetical protein
MFPSSRAVHTNPGSASTTRLSSFSIPGPFGIVAVTRGCATLRANVHHTLVSVYGNGGDHPPREYGTLDEILQFPDVAGPRTAEVYSSSCITRFVDKVLEGQDGDVLREGIRALSEALMEM